MRTVLATAGMLLVVAAIAAGVGEPEPPPTRKPTQWVRTVDGWEPLDTLYPVSRSEPRLHPLLVAGFQVMGSLGVLLAGTPSED